MQVPSMPIQIEGERKPQQRVYFNSLAEECKKLSSPPSTYYRPPNPLFLCSKNPVPYL